MTPSPDLPLLPLPPLVILDCRFAGTYVCTEVRNIMWWTRTICPYLLFELPVRTYMISTIIMCLNSVCTILQSILDITNFFHSTLKSFSSFLSSCVIPILIRNYSISFFVLLFMTLYPIFIFRIWVIFCYSWLGRSYILCEWNG